MDIEKFNKTVNSSGFPLQIAIENAVKSPNCEWRVLTKEHSWEKDAGDLGGFIDSILENNNKQDVLTIECKRARDTNWIFLQPDPKQNSRKHVKHWVTYYESGILKKYGWIDGTAEPSSPESEFCIIDRQDETKPMLERISSELITATESFARKDREYLIGNPNLLRFVTPVIVTTAQLQLCNFLPENISISSGEISGASYQTIPFLRFRKQLSTRAVDINKITKPTYYEISKAKENTVFIVNSDHFLEFLEQFQING
jgi:hypothetical protein